MDRRKRVPVEDGSFRRSMSMSEAKKVEALAQQLGRVVRKIVALDDSSFELLREMSPRVDYSGSRFLQDRLLGTTLAKVRAESLDTENKGRFPKPIVQDTLEEVTERRVARVERNLERERNRQPDPLQITLAIIGEQARLRISEMVRDHFERVPVSDGELDDMAGD